MPKQRSGQVAQCLVCNVDIYLAPSEIGRRKYCSHECLWRAQDDRRRRACARCGKEFGTSPSIGGKYCTRKCYELARQNRTNCAACGVLLAPEQLTYCSRPCMAVGRTTLEQRPCEVCGTMMDVQPHQIGKKRVCSRTCNHELKRLKGPGAKFTRKDGYVAVYYPKHPNASKDGIVLEHRLVMEQSIGRYLTRAEEINHINHVRDDNRIENLEIVSRGAHALESNAWGKQLRMRQRDQLAQYKSLYGPLPVAE